MRQLTRKTIDKIFSNELTEKEPHQLNVLIKLYKIAFPNYDNIKKIENWPTVGKETSTYLFEKFIKFDKQVHPDIFHGGLWLNNGFTTDNNTPNWKIDTSKCKITYKETKQNE